MTQALTPGVPTSIAQNVVWALPPNACFVYSSAAIEQSNEVGGSFTAATGANTTGVFLAGGFVRCTGGAAIVNCKYV